jgi:hypothetical protein
MDGWRKEIVLILVVFKADSNAVHVFGFDAHEDVRSVRV